MKTLLTFLLIVILSGADTLLAQSFDFSIKPRLVRMENQDLSPGLNAGFDMLKDTLLLGKKSSLFGKEYPQHKRFEISADLTLITEPSQNPETQKLSLAWGRLIVMKEAPVFGQPSPKGKGNLGYHFTLDYEANQNFEEQNLGAGGEIIYSNSEHDLIPSALLEFSFLYPVRSEIRDALAQENDPYGRINGALFWTIHLNRFVIVPELRYFRNYGLTDILETVGLDDGFYKSLTLAYSINKNVPLGDSGFSINQFFIKGNDGTLPVYTNDRETIEAGIEINF